MIPLRDNIPSRTTPVVNYAMIAICTLVFLNQASDPEGSIMRYGLVPARISHPGERLVVEERGRVASPIPGMQVITRREIPPAAVPEWSTLLSCVFLHGGLLHLAGNMWFLYIFGDNVEDRLGHVGYLIFYLGCGIAASLAHYLTDSQSLIPTIGASGAVAGVMGAYLMLYPHAMVMSLIPIFIFIHMAVIPAPVFLGIWFVLQLLQGTFSIGGTAAAGVAWWAHIGGFAAGYLVARFLEKGGQTRPRVVVVRPGTERASLYKIRRPD